MANSSGPLARSHILPRAARYLRTRGAAPEPILARFGLPAHAVSDPYVTISLSVLVDAMAALAAASGDPMFGFHLGMSLANDDTLYPVLEELGRSGATIASYLRLYRRISRAENEALCRTLETRRQLAILRTTMDGEPRCFGHHLNDCTQVILAHRLGKLAGTRIRFHKLWFADPAPRDLRAIRAMFDVHRVEVGVGSNGFSFSRSLLDTPIPTANSQVHALLLDHLDRFGLREPNTSRFLWRVRDTLDEQIRTGMPTIQTAARTLRTSSRSLQRRLAEHHTTFHALLDRVRAELALTYVEDDVQPAQVAVQLHYADVNSFARAFRRWTGTTPARFRSAHQ